MKLGVIGVGNMATAILGGIIKNNVLKPEEIIGSNRSEAGRNKAKENLGIHVTADNKEAAKAEIVMIGVHPDDHESIISEIKDVVSADTVIWTIAAGVTLADMENYFGRKVKVVRTMPNTPAQVGAGVTGVTPNNEVTEEELAKVRECIEATGIMEVIPESLMDGIIPVTGSAPAFIFMLINAMADGAVREGFPRKQAIRLAAATVLGSAKMVLETGKHPEELKDDVCTPGGITIEMVKKMEEVGFRNAVLEGMEACH